MRIWTTPNVKELYLNGLFPLTLREHEELKKTFIAEAGPDDIAILNLDAECRAFSDAVRKRGRSRILFITSGTAGQTEVLSNNAVALDAGRMKTAEIKQIISFIVDLALSRNEPGTISALQECGGSESSPGLRPIEDTATIRDMFAAVIKKNQPVILAFELTDQGEPVMAQSTCMIKEMQEGGMTLFNFRHPQFLKCLKKETCFRIMFPYKHENREGTVRIKEVMNTELSISIPEKLYPKKDIRIQPKKDEPVFLYILIPGEPTTNYRVLDISSRGVGFLCARDLTIGNSYTFSVVLPDPHAVIVTKGIIKHRKELYSGYQYGAEIRLHAWDADILAKYIMKREGEILGLLRTL